MDLHYEKDLVINGRELNYKGIFRAEELFRTVNLALNELGYEKREKKTEELVTEEGRKTLLELRPIKIKTNYVTLMLKIKILLNNVTETVEIMDGTKQKFQQGDVQLIFDAWYLTDYKDRWIMKPWNFFWKGLINKFIRPLQLENQLRDELVSDTCMVYNKVKNLFKSYNPAPQTPLSDEFVRQQMAKEITKGK